ncbi:isoprenyl transferase [Thermodesulfovibrio yellowstonii]|jgi:undecaprenyl diphosphate synthase|uniref:Isoprenyl transferase n=2 Tax=Thermodesulfovibrio yellowstonii TaxID=28262 RepID=B5YI11_THEYD|nr:MULTISPECIES: isoprenyl transferase [Thermodesulfovibrio]ACI21191.1 di-trans,poly-cis-decaprenylcistransferase [Thermodesulfovibrio yellowstonii DSM 11347]MDI6864700.1 isoprenyl transferase [Thermodesulfovibrio yellowstonii]GLI54414.1 isoprenyl transferase [Thermodesulfovibrio islandicus]
MSRFIKHVGIIMDGNGRWAQLRGLPRYEGHKRGVEKVKEIIRSAIRLNIDVLTFYAFSIENWQRPKKEVEIIMDLLQNHLRKETQTFISQGVRFKMIGNRDMIPKNILNVIEETESATSECKELIAQFAISYGGRDEIIRAVKKIIINNTVPEKVDEDFFSSMLDTAGIPEPDLIIRTSGEQRISNFLVWQSAYSEFYFSQTLWPDFTEEEFTEAILDFQKRQRRFGKVSEFTRP